VDGGVFKKPRQAKCQGFFISFTAINFLYMAANGFKKDDKRTSYSNNEKIIQSPQTWGYLLKNR